MPKPSRSEEKRETDSKKRQRKLLLKKSLRKRMLQELRLSQRPRRPLQQRSQARELLQLPEVSRLDQA